MDQLGSVLSASDETGSPAMTGQGEVMSKSGDLRWLAEHGVAFVKVQRLDKRPLESGWRGKALTLADITPHVRAGGNVGVLTGRHSNGICMLDLDRDFDRFCHDNQRWAASLQAIRADAPDRGKILVRVTDEIPRSRVWTRQGDRKPSAEWLADGRQGVIPPSVHPDGLPYEWRNAGSPILEVAAVEVEIVWAIWTGEQLTPRPQAMAQRALPYASRLDDGLVDKVKAAWPSALAVFDHHGLAAEIETAGRNEVRVKGNGGLLCGIGSTAWRWYCHSDQTGGDQIDAWGRVRYGTGWERNDPAQFRSVLHEMAGAAGIAIDEARSRAQPAATSSPKQRVDAALANAQKTLDPGIPFDVAADLAVLSVADLERAIGSFRDILGRQLNLNSLRKLIKEQQSNAQSPRQADKVDDGSQSRPAIVINGRQLRELTKDSIAALMAVNDPPSIFTRGTGMARIGRASNSQLRIKSMDEAQVRNALAREANYFCQDPLTGKLSAALTPRQVAQDILAEPELPFPPLNQIVELPVLRPDGSILGKPGYDQATGIFYEPAPDVDIPRVPDSPSVGDIAASVALLRELYGDFSFVNEASFANAVALTLTPLVRSAIEGNAPMAAITSKRAGTGKTLLTESVAMICTGQPASIMSDPGRDEEWRKQITSKLKEGATLIVIDNVDGLLRASPLARALTARRWNDRFLGGNESVDLPQRATWMVTGNNLKLSGDLPRRGYWIEMDAKMARPWERSGFRHPALLQWVKANRGCLIAALLTMARSWYAAGQPAAETAIMGSFDEWVRVVGGILTHCGIPGFLGSQAAMYEKMADGEFEWETFLLAWESCIGKREVMTADVAGMLGKPEGRSLKETLPTAKLVGSYESDQASSFSRKLGKALAEKQGIRFGERNLHIARVSTSSRSGQPIWQLDGDRLEMPG